MRSPAYFALMFALVLSGCGGAKIVSAGDGGGYYPGSGYYPDPEPPAGSGGSGGASDPGSSDPGTGDPGGAGGSGGTDPGGSGASSGGAGGSGASSGGAGGSGAEAVRLHLPEVDFSKLEYPPVQGVVDGGDGHPIVGSRVYVLEAGVLEAGTPLLASGSFRDTRLGRLQPITLTSARTASRSLLTSTTGHSDALGNYVLTDDSGAFWIFADYTCTPGHQVYLYARGGNSGHGANTAIGLIAVLGACPDSGTFNSAVPFAFVNEVSTVAAAYALSHYAADATHIFAARGSLDEINLFNAFTDAQRLAQVSTGRPERRAPRSQLNTLANILAACVNSSGPDTAACKSLLQNASSPGEAPAVDTASAAIHIAHHPRAKVAQLFALQPAADAPFSPALETEPDDFTIAIPRGISKLDE